MNAAELAEMAELLADALECFDAGEAYAHHARLPVSLVLQRLKAASAALAKEVPPDGTQRRNPTHWH